ncbi:MAG: ATP-binding cassette domain-containing protein, partial [Lentibacter algarum]
MTEAFVRVRDLKIGATVYPPGEKPHDIEIVHGVSFDLEKGKVLGLIGESGAGKSTIGLASMATIVAADVIYHTNPFPFHEGNTMMITIDTLKTLLP